MGTALILLAAFGAGVLNTIAGGGTFLTFPALVFSGVPPVAANATSAVAVFPGYLGGAVGFRRELGSFNRKTLVRLTVVTLAGSVVGSLLLTVSSNKAFSVVVPFLLFGATLSFLYGDRFRRWAAKRKRSIKPFGSVGLFFVSVYGGYFNGGLGIVLLAIFTLWGMSNLLEMNGLKNGLSVALSAVSVVIFSMGGLVEWYQAVLMMVASTVGGYLGAPVARVLPRPLIRFVIVVVGFSMSAVFLWRVVF